MIKCLVMGCPYLSKNGFCRRKFVFVNNNGNCEQIYTKGGLFKGDWQTNFNENLAEQNIIQKQEKEKESETKGGAGASPQDALTQTSAVLDDKESC